MDTPEDLRKKLKRLRQSLPLDQQAEASKACVQHLKNFILAQNPLPKNIALYLPIQGEIDVSTLPELLSLSIQYFLPIVTHPQEPLVFGKWSPEQKLIPNRFGILEPDRHAPQIKPEALDLVCMPLVGFDRQGHRLGMGAGYYDRTFAFRSHLTPPPLLVGIGYHFQEVPTLILNPWDISCDVIVTERGRLNMPERSSP